MDINKLILQANKEYLPLKLKSKDSTLTKEESDNLSALSVKLNLYKILKTSFMEELTKNQKVIAYLTENKLVTFHQETAVDSSGKTVSVDVPDQSMEERISLIPDIFTTPIIEKMVKGHKENIKIFEQTSDSRLTNEQLELDVLESFLPKEATEEDINAYLNEHYPSGINKKQAGKVIGEIKKAFKRADGKLISQCVFKKAV